jgi:hypothetical protein
MKNHASILGLSREFGVDQQTVKRLLVARGLTHQDLKDRKQAQAVRTALAQYKAELGPVSGTSTKPGPRQRKYEEEVKILERRNRIEDLLERKEYMRTSDVEKMFLMGLQKIELVPEKMQSEFGLPDAQRRRLQELLDEARTEWSKGICNSRLTNDAPAAEEPAEKVKKTRQNKK